MISRSLGLSTRPGRYQLERESWTAAQAWAVLSRP